MVLMGHLSYAETVKEMTTSTNRSAAKETDIMSLQIVRFTATSDHAVDIEAGIEKMFAALEAAAPQRVQYLAARTVETADFTLLLHLAGNRTNPLLEITEATAFRTALPGWTVNRSAPQQMTVLGDYRMLNGR
jgi:hypothetical protein